MIGVFMALANVYDQGVPHLIGRIPLAFLILVTVLGKANCSELLPADINQYSRSSIGKLYNRAGEACTGVIISPVQVATAAHCLYNPRTGMLLHPESLHFLMGYKQGEYREDLRVSEFRIGSNYALDNRTMDTETSDWAVLQLKQPGPEQFRAVSLAERSAQTGDSIMVGGFAQSSKYSMTADTNCSVRGVLPNGLILHDCAVLKGDSGAPIMIKSGEMIEILGIQVAEATLRGTPVQIAVPVSDLVAIQK
jgi:protease YdgD